MRFILKSFLILSSVSTFLLILIFASIKFQLMDPKFWTSAFETRAVYQKLSVVLKDSLAKAFVDEGLKKEESIEIASILTPEAIKDFTEQNTFNIFDFVNGKATEIIVYFPLDKLPSDIRRSLQINSDEISLNYLLATFGKGSSPIGGEVFIQLKHLNGYINALLIAALVVHIITLFCIYKLEGYESRLIGVTASFSLSGFVTLVIVLLGNLQLKNIESARNITEPSQKLLAIILPPVLYEIFTLWLIIAGVSLLGGLAFLLIKKAPAPKGTSLLKNKV